MDIIFVRHGIAEEISVDLEDLKRKLTKKGKKSIKITSNQIVNHIKSGNEIFIWSSPALRAIQTAKIIADRLKVCNVKIYPFIWDGDYISFVNEVKGLNKKSTLIVIGHEPHLSTWSRQIQDKKILFEKGTMVGFEIQKMEPLQGTVRWTLYPSSIKMKEKNTRKKKVISKEEFYKILKENIREIEIYKSQFLLFTEDKETVHRLRIKIRRIRSLLSFVRPLIEVSDYAFIQEKLKNIEQKFSKIREIDVLLTGWNLLSSNKLELQKNKDSLREMLEIERRQEVVMLLEYDRTGEFDKEIIEISDAVKQLEIDVKEGTSFSIFTTQRLIKWHNKLKNSIKMLSDTDIEIEAIHNIRIEFKKVRYVEDCLSSFDIRKKWNLSELEKIQDVLGDLCDTYRNISFLKEMTELSENALFQYYAGIFTGYEVARREQLIKRTIKQLTGGTLI